MKSLTIIRHGKTKKQKPNERDFDRHLKQDGVSASHRLGELLSQSGCVADLVITSPAVRARQTAEALCNGAGISPETIIEEPVLYENDTSLITGMLREISDEKNAVFIVGHNPSFTELTNTLCGRVIENMQTASAACIELPVNSWSKINSGDAVLKSYISA